VLTIEAIARRIQILEDENVIPQAPYRYDHVRGCGGPAQKSGNRR
jgi:hypothetical protein